MHTINVTLLLQNIRTRTTYTQHFCTVKRKKFNAPHIKYLYFPARNYVGHDLFLKAMMSPKMGKDLPHQDLGPVKTNKQTHAYTNKPQHRGF